MPSFGIIFGYGAVALAALVPVVGWAYLFSYFSGDALSARRFAAGMASGGAAALAILLLNRALSGNLAAFHPYAALGASPFPWEFFAGLAGSGLVLLAAGALLAVSVVPDPLPALKVAARAVPAVILAALAIALARAALGRWEFWGFARAVEVGGKPYASLGALLAYFLAVGAVEETAKFGNWLPGFPRARSPKDALMAALFVALGFVFVENVVYAAAEIRAGRSAFGNIAVRSVFSAAVHMLCAAYLASKVIGAPTPRAFVGRAGYGLLAAAAIHGAFNAGTSAGWSWVPLLYLAAGYVMAGKAFAREDMTGGGIPPCGEADLPGPVPTAA